MVALRLALKHIVDEPSETDKGVIRLRKEMAALGYTSLPKESLSREEGFNQLRQWSIALTQTPTSLQWINNVNRTAIGSPITAFPGQGDGIGEKVAKLLWRASQAAIAMVQQQQQLIVTGGEEEEITTDSGARRGRRAEEETPCPTLYRGRDLGVSFADIKGQQATKDALRTAFILPLKWKRILRKSGVNLLLYGPPGTGTCSILHKRLICV